MEKPSVKLASHFVLTASLSGGMTIVISLVYILLCIAALIFRNNCSEGSMFAANGAEYFWKTIFSAYILKTECEASLDSTLWVNNGITGEYTVFVLTTITLSFSVLCLVTACILVTVVQDDKTVRYINMVVFAYIASCIASLIVDLTTASHFGIDYTNLSSLMETLTPGVGSNYKSEVLRQGAFYMMTIALKGYVVWAINLILLTLLVIYMMEHRQRVKNSEHSIHKLGALVAFEAQLNNRFLQDDQTPPRTPKREPQRKSEDFHNSNRSYDRSDSWHHSQVNPVNNARPFTYLEDIKRPVPSRPPPSTAVETPWRREPWPPAPPVPAPDYSPQPARRLKSALKPVYM